MGGNDLKQAERLYRSKKYSKVLGILEPQVFRYRESFRFFYLLGMSCLKTGDYGGAYSYLQRALNIRSGDTKTLLGIAAVHLRRQETAEAIRIWFEIIDKEPKNPHANRGLKLLRKNADSDKLVEFTESRKFNSILPNERNFRPLFFGLAALVLATAGVFFYPYASDFVKDRFLDKRQEITRLDLQIEESYSGTAPESTDSVKFSFEEKEIKKKYRRILEAFHNYNDNLARREINRLMHSNASKEVRSKLTLLEGHIRTPSFGELSTNFSYEKVSQSPELYEKCHVIWKGRVSNLKVGSDAIRFDFLVGYETEKVVKGIVPVTVPFAVDINPAYPIEILGRVRLRENGISLEAQSIHQFSQPEEKQEEKE